MRNLHKILRRVQSKTSRSRTQVKLWSWGATIHKSEQPCTSAGARALVRNSLYCDQAQRSRIAVPVLDHVADPEARRPQPPCRGRGQRPWECVSSAGALRILAVDDLRLLGLLAGRKTVGKRAHY